MSSWKVPSELAAGTLAEVTAAHSVVGVQIGRAHFSLTPGEALVMAESLADAAHLVLKTSAPK
jgi:hypothetical protein